MPWIESFFLQLLPVNSLHKAMFKNSITFPYLWMKPKIHFRNPCKKSKLPTFSPTRGVAFKSLDSITTVSVMAENYPNETLSSKSTTTLGKTRGELIKTLYATKVHVQTARFGRHIEKWLVQIGNTHFRNQKTANLWIMQALYCGLELHARLLRFKVSLKETLWIWTHSFWVTLWINMLTEFSFWA